MFKDYLLLTKPGIIMGNLIAATSGFLLASKGNPNISLLCVVWLGTTLVIASGCVLNNIVDRDIDSKMSRTQNRAVTAGRISVGAALWYGVAIGVLGFYTIAKTNSAAVFFAALGFAVYVGLYTVLYKRSTVYGTLIGSLSGACPPVIGYVSVTGTFFDPGAAIILLTFCLWQIPHSYAIAIYRFDDYKAADIPVLPIKQGVEAARKQMIWYIIGFGVAALALSYFGYVGYWYALIIGLGSLYWLYLAKTSYPPEDEKLWAKRLFVFSIVIIVAFSVLISVDFTHTTQPLNLGKIFSQYF